MQSEARYDDESITVRNSEINYGLYDGKLRRFYLQTATVHDLKSNFSVTLDASHLLIGFS